MPTNTQATLPPPHSELTELLDRRRQRRKLFPRAALVGLSAGIVAVAFRALLAAGDMARTALIEWSHQAPAFGWLAPLIFGAIGATLAVVLVRRYAPEASGSGIPHTEAVLQRIRELHWRRILPVKLAGGTLAIGAGLALGREGPTVQMGGAMGAAVAERLGSPPRERLTLIAAGAGAGLAAAFNAPLAGLIFVLEEVQRDFRPMVFGAAFIAAAVADILSRLTVGQLPVFAIPSYPMPPLSALPAFALLGVVCGLGGVLFNRGLLHTLDLFGQLRERQVLLGAASVGATAGLVGWFVPELAGGGHDLTEAALVGGVALAAIPLLFLLRFGLTLVSYGTGAPGGIFAPLLVLGALIGLAVGELIHGLAPALAPQPAAFAVVGMAAYFSAIVRAPLTGIVLIAEMTGNYNQMLPLLVACFCAYAVAEVLRDTPIYEALLQRDLRRSGTAHSLHAPMVLELEVEPGAPFAGLRIRELGLPPGCMIVRCRDGGREWVPTAATRIEPHMRLTAMVAPEAAAGLPALRYGCAEATP
jgi:chloride channel protein, CIC family